MGLLNTKQNLESIFGTEWTYTKIAWSNVEFDTLQETEWVRFTILTGDSEQASAGGDTNFYRSVGVIAIQIFVEPNSGAKRALELADNAISMWRSRIVDNTVCSAPYATIVGVSDGWYQVNVLCNYHTDDIV